MTQVSSIIRAFMHGTRVLFARNISTSLPATAGAMTESQNRAILTAALVCSSVSLLTALVALRWFVLMRRCFRHTLVLMLVISDTFKALWYFVFPVISFAVGPVPNDSNFCQASGFFLALGIEMADFAIFAIALHALLHIFLPPNKMGEGGLYPWRRWIYAFWLGPPLIAASLAFLNGENSYVTSGTFCYLPKRPYWYRLALSWIPRYIIIITIFVMYAAIYIYVHLKFKGFANLAAQDSSSGSGPTSNIASRASPQPSISVHPLSPKSMQQVPTAMFDRDLNRLSAHRPPALRLPSHHSIVSTTSKQIPEPREPWDNVNFITAKALQSDDIAPDEIVKPTDAARQFGSASTAATYVARPNPTLQVNHDDIEDGRKPSYPPTTDFTQQRNSGNATILKDNDLGVADPLRNTRVAIRRQLRFLFIYPAIYVLMWTVPFVNHILTYDDYYVTHPAFGMSIATTIFMSMQAGVDCVVFSWREKPWNKIDKNSAFTIPFWRQQGKQFIRRASRRSTIDDSSDASLAEQSPRPSQPTPWWEAEGKRRKDSVWMGTDILERITSAHRREKTEPTAEDDEENDKENDQEKEIV